MRPRMGVLLSGAGTTYANLARHALAGTLGADIVAVIGSRPDAGGLSLAAEFGHPTAIARQADAVTAILAERRVEWVAMCGWLRYWDPPEPWRGRTLNTHPGLLPLFGGKGMYGHHVHEAVLTAGCKVSGCTVHLVEGAYDSGPILAQDTVAVLPDDTPESLAVRVQAAERRLYPVVLDACCAGRMRRRDGRCWVEDRAGRPIPPVKAG